jgi:hypothetical protein
MRKALIICITVFLISCSKEHDSYEVTINKEITSGEVISINLHEPCDIKHWEIVKPPQNGIDAFSYILCQECLYNYGTINDYIGYDQTIIKIVTRNRDIYTYTINIHAK